MSTLLYGATIFTPTKIIEDGAIVVSNTGKIDYVGLKKNAPNTYGLQLDAKGKIIVPGFIDIHVHGGNGVNFCGNENLSNDLKRYSSWIASTGVTGFLCSIAAKKTSSLLEMIEDYVPVFENGINGSEPLGIHLEGPFINKNEKRGGFNPAWLREPSLEEAKSYLLAGKSWIRQMTLDPELPGADEIARYYRESGVVVALGHSNANYEVASEALSNNYTHVTHTYNALRGFHHRNPGVMGAVLASDNITAELIADTIHVHPCAMKVLARCLGIDRIVLITDAIEGAGMKTGVFEIMGHKVFVQDGRSTLSDGTLAGSIATMDQCIRNMNRQVGVPLNQSIQMATLNAARTIGVSDRLGSIKVGKDASITIIDNDVNVFLTMVKGKIVHNNLP